MSEPNRKRKRSRSSSGGHDPHRPIGYGNPPRATQYEPGRSGNPKGRPRKQPSPIEVIRAMFAEPVNVREADGVKQISMLEAFLKQLRKSALEGDQRAIPHVLKLMQMAGLEGPKDEAGARLRGAEAEDAILKWLAGLVGKDPE